MNSTKLIATGVVGDYGKGETVLPNGDIDPEQWNTSNCSGRISFSTQLPVVAGSGTGAYRGITGSVSY